ncbi:MAG: DUF5057 domain-containing protein [Lachnospiraceae bacterium]|nr:DUF5057 domain-containing protein [Lachnospiraceae bacterium]
MDKNRRLKNIIQSAIKHIQGRTVKRILAGILAVAVVVSVIPFAGILLNLCGDTVKAEEKNSNGDGRFYIPKSNDTAKLGTSDNPFTILEIVPNASKASFGYLIGGQEPVDIERIVEDGKEKLLSAYIKSNSTNLDVEDVEFKSVLDEKLKNNTITQKEYKLYNNKSSENSNHYGIFKKVAKNEGNYNLSVRSETIDAFYEVDSGKGDYVITYDYYKIAPDKYDSSQKYHVIDGNPVKGEWNQNGEPQNSSVYTYTYYTSKGDYKRSSVKNGQNYYYQYDVDDATAYVKKGRLTGTVREDTRSDGAAKYSVNFKAVSVADEKEFNDKRVKNKNYFYYVPVGEMKYKYVGEGKGNYKKKIKYVYSLVNVGDNKGEYVFEGLSYKDNAKISQEDINKSVWFNDCSLESREELKTETLPGYITGDDILIKYKQEEAYKNTELFKKYGLGLAYKDNDISKGEEVEAYEFEGWFYDKFGVNKFDEAQRLTKNTNVYAKWKTVYPSGAVPSYTVTFDKNCNDPEEYVYNMSEGDVGILAKGITGIEENSCITEPSITPKRSDYIFTGWYTDSSCTHMYDYNTKLTSDITLYAGWKPVAIDDNGDKITYNIRFDANSDNADDEIIVPETIKGYQANGLLNNFTMPSVSDPVRDGYTFAGWYYNKACTKVFSFGENLPESITVNTITLYAKWVDNNIGEGYELNFFMNEPSVAINEAVLKDNDTETDIKSVKADKAGYIEAGIVPKLKPELEGNISAKLDQYKVRVMTVTPQDINGSGETASHNRGLIDRANLIVINQTVNNGLSDLWKDYKNEKLFCNTSEYDISKKRLGIGVDLDWIATERIWKKVSVGNTGKAKSVAPIIFDHNIYKEIVDNVDTSVDKGTIKRFYSDSTSTNAKYKEISLENGSSYNVYKLFLLTQQMNPVTLYNAYLAYPGGDTKQNKANWSNCYIDTTGKFVNSKDNATNVWNSDILTPYEAMLKSDGEDDNYADLLETIGFNGNPGLLKSDPVTLIRHRSMITAGNMLAEFVNKADLIGNVDMKEYMEKLNVSGKGVSGDRFSMTDGVYYLLNSKVTTTNVARDLNILQIQPSDDNNVYKSATYWYWYIARYVSNYSGKITTDSMSSSEFIARNVDLNADYDVVYIGANISGLSSIVADTMPSCLVENGNDKKIYSYAHTGKVVENASAYKHFGGLLDDSESPSEKVAYSGNDITKTKLNALLKYAKTGYPIVFGRDVLNFSGLVDFDSLDINDVNTNKIDMASNIYELLYSLFNEVGSGGKRVYDGSFFFENQYNSKEQNKKFTEALTVKKFYINLVTPLEYKDRTIKANKDLTDEQVYINGGDINDKSLKFTLKINSQVANNYIVKLYVDTNADGKFSEEEKLDSLEIYDKTSKRYIRYNHLVKDHEYVIERAIDDYVGAIPWKLVVIDSANTDVRCSKTGMCAIKTDEKTKINILQINTDGMFDSNGNEISSYATTLCLPTTDEIAKAKANHSGSDITESTKNTFFNGVDSNKTKAGASKYYYYMSRLKEFDINISRLTVSEFQDKVEKYPNFFKENKEGPGETCIKYNMLIIGFADCYSDITSEAGLKLIEKFINEGNTVLFTHDTTSFVNMDNATYTGYTSKYKWWGYNINQYFRGILGMDRYDVKVNKGSKVGLDDAPDRVYKTGYRQSEGKYETNSSGKILAQGISGFSLKGYSGSQTTRTVTKTNSGQLAEYPYTLDNSFSVSATHSQYYQLDLESDDIVVWYSLYGNNYGYDLKNDARNNYYIYNKGNITYSGVGHSNGITDDEAKLFVNTMVAAYNATVQPTVPVITNVDKSTDNYDTDFLYVDYDATVASAEDAVPFGEGVFKTNVDDMDGESSECITKRTYFTLKNNSIVLNKQMTVHYYPVIVNDDGTETVLDGTDGNPLVELPLTTYRYDFDDESKTGMALSRDKKVHLSSGEITGSIVESGEYYYVDVPIQDVFYNSISYKGKTFAALDEENKFKIQIQVVMRYGKDISANEPLIGFRNVVYMRRGNFILD